jgi:acetolactate synthase I/II/III large subunit
MKVYEAFVKGLESIGVSAAFGGAGENANGLTEEHQLHDQRWHPAG